MTAAVVFRGGGRPRRGLWALSGVEVAAYEGQPQFAHLWPVGRPFCLRVAMLLTLVISDRRVHPSGQALCLLGRVSARVAARLATFFVAAVLVLGLLAAVSVWTLVALAAMLLVVFAPVSVGAVRGLPSKRQLQACTPPGRHVLVHSVASVRPGAGREVLVALNEEADRRGWSLMLDAANERLAAYYAELGFVAVSGPVRSPGGECSVRMVRTPREGTLR